MGANHQSIHILCLALAMKWWASFLTVAVVALWTCVSAQDYLQLKNNSLPLLYDVTLTLNVAEKSFSSDVAIQITVLEDTQVLEINSRSELEVDWLKGYRVISESGKEFVPVQFEYEEDRETVVLEFEEVLLGEANYTVYIKNVRGSFGRGFIEDHQESQCVNENLFTIVEFRF